MMTISKIILIFAPVPPHTNKPRDSEPGYTNSPDALKRGVWLKVGGTTFIIKSGEFFLSPLMP